MRFGDRVSALTPPSAACAALRNQEYRAHRCEADDGNNKMGPGARWLGPRRRLQTWGPLRGYATQATRAFTKWRTGRPAPSAPPIGYRMGLDGSGWDGQVFLARVSAATRRLHYGMESCLGTRRTAADALPLQSALARPGRTPTLSIKPRHRDRGFDSQ